MALVDPPVVSFTEEDIARFEELVSFIGGHRPILYWSAFAAAAGQAGKDGNAERERMLTFLARLFAIDLDPPGRRRADGWAKPTWEDLGDEELPLIRTLAERLVDPNCRARMAHLLWLRAKDHKMADAAVDEYLKAAAEVESPDKWPACIDRYAAALHLAASTGKGDSYGRVIGRLDAALKKHVDTDTSFFSHKLMTLLFEQRRHDVVFFAEKSEEIARRLHAAGNHHAARQYWLLKIDLERTRGDAGAKTAERSFAEVYEHEAEKRAENGDYAAAVLLLQNAVGYLGRHGGHGQHIAELRRRLAIYGPKANAEIDPIRASIPVGDMIEQTLKAVRGKDLAGALLALADIHRPIRVSHYRESAIAGIQNFPMQHLFGLTVVGHDGSVVARRKGIDPAHPEADEETLLGLMVQESAIHRGVAVTARIGPARHVVLTEHAPNQGELLSLMNESPFVPPGREGLYARGIWAGFDGDFLIATHILVPQLENSIRFVLAQQGVQAVKIKPEGIDEQKTFSSLLALPETAKIFGEDLVFDMRAVLDHRLGPNFRNNLAHGLSPLAAFSSTDAVYVWWLVFRICLLPFLNRLRREATETGPESSETPIEE